MSYDPHEKCGLEWFAEGKDHKCEMNPPASVIPHRCICSCGQVRGKNEGPRTAASPQGNHKKPFPKLAKWKRGKKIVMDSDQAGRAA